MLCNTAIFYDIENLLAMFNSKSNSTVNLGVIHQRVLSLERVNGVSIQRAYTDWSSPIPKHLREVILQVGIEPIQVFNATPYDKVKNASDINLIIDVIDTIAKHPEIENYVIASGDGIFAYLAKKLHEHGKFVIGCGIEAISSALFRGACDYFISLERHEMQQVTTKKVVAKNTPTDTVILAENNNNSKAISKKEHMKAKVLAKQDSQGKTQVPELAKEIPPNIQTPLAEKVENQIEASTLVIPLKLPKSRYTEAVVQANIEVFRDKGDSAGCFHVIRNLVEAAFSDSTKDLLSMELSIFMMYVNHYIPNFKPSKHGFKGVGELMRLILTNSPYCTYTHDKEENIVRIGLRSNVESTSTIVEDIEGLIFMLHDGRKYHSVFDIPADEPFIYTIPQVAPPQKIVPVAQEVQKIQEPQKTQPVQPVQKTQKQKNPSKKTVPKAETITKATKAKKPEKIDSKPVEPALVVPEIDKPKEEIIPDEKSIRKWIKEQFLNLKNEQMLSASEAEKLTQKEYSFATFGVRLPIFREVLPGADIENLRISNKKPKYWSEEFEFGKKKYLIFKEWVSHTHKDRFVAWLASVSKAKK